MANVRPLTKLTMSRRRLTIRSFAGIILIFLIGAGLLIFEQRHLRKHLPLINAELVEAELEGPRLLEVIGAPPGTTPYSDGIKVFPEESRKSHWQGTKTRVRWSREWESPGNHESVQAWFAKNLGAQGWQVIERGFPSILVKYFGKDKWSLTLSRGADFSTDRDPKVRYTLDLEWDYWFKVEDWRP
jgi:hypothetical protein